MYEKEPKHNGLSIAGFVVSLVGMFINFLGIVNVVGLVLSVLGRNAAIRDGDKTGLATAGMVLGIIGVVFVVLVYASCLAFA